MSRLKSHPSDTMRAVHEAIASGSSTVPEIVDATGIRPGTVYEYVRRLYAHGWVENPRRGVYRATGTVPVFGLADAGEPDSARQ